LEPPPLTDLYVTPPLAELTEPEPEHGAGGSGGAAASGAGDAAPGALSGAITILLSGLGLLTDTYDLQVINLARAFIAYDHPMTPRDEALITTSAIAGAGGPRPAPTLALRPPSRCPLARKHS
jgi:hypothetical protein